MRIQEMTQKASSRKTPRNLKETKENWRKIENPRNDKKRNFQENAWNLMEIRKNRRKIENPINKKELNFQEIANEDEEDKEKLEKK